MNPKLKSALDQIDEAVQAAVEDKDSPWEGVADYGTVRADAAARAAEIAATLGYEVSEPLLAGMVTAVVYAEGVATEAHEYGDRQTVIAMQSFALSFGALLPILARNRL